MSLSLIPPGAPQYFSFVKAESAEYMQRCTFVQILKSLVAFFFPSFKCGGFIQYLVAFLFMLLTCCFTDLFAQIPLNYTLFSF